MVKGAVFHVFGEGNRRQVAHCDFVGSGVLDNLRTEVRRANDAQILLVGFCVTRVFVEHVRGARFNLGFHDFGPKLTCGNGLAAFAFRLVLDVEGLKFGTVGIVQPGALVGAHQGPLGVLFHALHEEVRNPKGVEQVTRALLFLTRVLAEIQEVKHVGVPGLQVHGKGSFALAAALVDVAGRIVEYTEQGDQSV